MSGVDRLEDFLYLNDTELLERLGDVSLEKIRETQMEVAEGQCPKSMTVQEMLEQRAEMRQRSVSSSLESLDRCLKGGIPRGNITELVGPATVGKSQFCFIVAILEAAPVHIGGNNGTVMYFDTEGKFSVKRMAEIIENKWSEHGFEMAEIKERILDNILVVKPDTNAQLMLHLQKLESSVKHHGASLVIIDSIAAILRAEFGYNELSQRQSFVGEQATQLKLIASACNLPILVTNQVTAQMGTASTTVMGDSTSVMYDGVIPALGTKWAHAVNTRLSLERIAQGTKRVVTIRKSPSSPNDQLYYKITSNGIEPDV